MAFLIVCACIGIAVVFVIVSAQEDLDRQQRIRREIEIRSKNDAARTAYKDSTERMEAGAVRERNRAERLRPKFYMTPDGLKQFGGDDI